MSNKRPLSTVSTILVLVVPPATAHYYSDKRRTRSIPRLDVVPLRNQARYSKSPALTLKRLFDVRLTQRRGKQIFNRDDKFSRAAFHDSPEFCRRLESSCRRQIGKPEPAGPQVSILSVPFFRGFNNARTLNRDLFPPSRSSPCCNGTTAGMSSKRQDNTISCLRVGSKIFFFFF